MADGKVTVLARIQAKAGMEETVKQELLALVAATRAEEGCLNYDLHQSSQDPALFLFYENWASREALDQHSRSSQIQAWRAQAGDLLAAPTEVTLWEMIS